MRDFSIGVVFGIVGVIVTFLALTLAARAEPKTVLVLDQVITGYALEPLTDAVRKNVVDRKKSDIVIMISSPGGEVGAGMAFINMLDAAKAQGNRVTCYVQDIAASMAFQILTRCDRRYALPTSQLLWHGVRIQTRETITAERAQEFHDQIARLNEAFKYQLYPVMGMSRSKVDTAFLAETLWTGISLRKAAPDFIQLLPSYPDLWPLTKTGGHMAENPMNSLFSDIVPGDDTYRILYIWSGYQQKDAQ